jgi:16S rRNA (cytosine967-C5)-methyltransferase
MAAEEAGARAGLAVRKTAARLLAAVIDARASLDGLTDNRHGHPHYLALDQRDRALVRAILGSALRRRRTLERVIARRLQRPLPENARTLSHILHVAAAQILFLSVPSHAAVDLAVTHAQLDPRTRRFSALVNAVLRGIVQDLAADPAIAAPAGAEAPDWLIARLETVYGRERAAAIFAAHLAEPPVDLTVKNAAELWAERVGGFVLPTGSVRLVRPGVPIDQLPGYGEGAWWVQDAAAALPARLLGDPGGLRVADLCAAPGGKTAQLAAAGASVTAVDSSRSRLSRLAINLERLRLTAEIVAADVLEWKPGQPFDAVLLDAPCSSTGTIRRHPDVAWTKTPDDIAKLAALQRRLLDRAAAWLRPGGRLVFSTCSLDPVEGEMLIGEFLAARPNMEIEPIRPGELPGIDPWINASGMLRTTPADLNLGDPARSGMDGFFAARLRRIG